MPGEESIKRIWFDSVKFSFAGRDFHLSNIKYNFRLVKEDPFSEISTKFRINNLRTKFKDNLFCRNKYILLLRWISYNFRFFKNILK